MSVSTRWAIVCAVVVLLVGGNSLITPEDKEDPQAYPGSRTAYTVDDIERLTRVRLPGCARPNVRYILGPVYAEDVALDFTATPECVAEFLTGLGADVARPDYVGQPGDSRAFSLPPETGTQWEFGPRTRLEEWLRILPGSYREQVKVAVDRSVQPPHVYLHAFALD
ncbi:hypothetical protein [Actinokineospora terrae]|uniref:Uncharacterized protein n=1 Tax=Actinokineospora terrae TaxID=155974 RepID=A0A1H9X2A4_9PSEU|nr:hypothetical protein [Actinokineospora terrae]SES40322.1 hypothetical protein SAMN04487818_112188 [Actinokineospora terrae]